MAKSKKLRSELWKIVKHREYGSLSAYPVEENGFRVNDTDIIGNARVTFIDRSTWEFDKFESLSKAVIAAHAEGIYHVTWC